jgi:hypothetical protein
MAALAPGRGNNGASGNVIKPVMPLRHIADTLIASKLAK